jgi:peptidylprolyl isomerase
VDIQATAAASGAIVTDSGLQYVVLEQGDGPSPQEGEVVALIYRVSLEDGTEFDSSYQRGELLTFPLGQGMVLPGLDEGIALMKLGEVALLIIPPELAFGEEGISGVVPANATLYFQVQLAGIGPGSPDAPTVVDEADYVTTDSGLKYYDLVDGDGPIPEAGQQVSVRYTGWLEDGTKFDSSIDRGQSFVFPLGSSGVIAGWDEGLSTMKVGGQRQLVIPPDLAYGEEGASGVIPANATLIFEVELIEILPGSPEAPAEVDEADYVTTESGLKYYDLVVGDGEEAENGKLAEVHYTGWLTDGTKFDSSLDRGEPFLFGIGAGSVIDGWELGVLGMKVGGQRQLVIPAELGYGVGGSGTIPGNATLIFEIELLELR